MRGQINYCYVDGCKERCVGRGLCKLHYYRWKRTGDPVATPRFCSLDERFWRYVNKTETCWIWTGALSKGYGCFVVQQRPTKCVRAHRYSYESIVGPIPDGLTIDHLCGNKSCVNPSHLEPVTIRVNVLRNNGPTAKNAAATHCKHGHPFDEVNTYIYKNKNARKCRACERLRMQLKRAALRSPDP